MYEIYSIYDSASQSYNNPFFFLNDNICRRAAIDLLQSDTEIARHPEDFHIVKLGAYHPSTGDIDLHKERPVLLRFHELQATLKASEPELEQAVRSIASDKFKQAKEA